MGRGRGASVVLEGAGGHASLRSRVGQTAAQLVDGTPFTAAELFRYADRLLEIAGVGEGDVVGLEIDNHAQVAGVEALQDMAARRGAMVEVLVSGFVAEERVENLIAADGVLVHLSTFTPPPAVDMFELEMARADVAEAVYGERTALASDGLEIPAPSAYGSSVAAFETYAEASRTKDLRVSYAVWPSREWAASVYPELSSEEGFRQLGQDMLGFCRCGPEDGPGAWEEHIAQLAARAEALNELGPVSLRYQGPGIDLSVDVAPGAEFMPTAWKTSSGHEVCINAPTEEIFTTPDPASANGVIETTKPLVVTDANGATHVIDGIRVQMEEGRIAEIDCAEERYRDYLRERFSEATGADRIGELGLVDLSSRIAATGRTYHNTFLDENAGGVHFGFGSSWDFLTGGEGNTSSTDDHCDLICGSDQITVTVIAIDGSSTNVIENGHWTI